MRDKIKELAKQAVNELHTDKEGALLMTPMLDKFADLIINECISSIEEVKTFPVTTYERDMTDAETVNKCIKAVKDKFK